MTFSIIQNVNMRLFFYILACLTAFLFGTPVNKELITAFLFGTPVFKDNYGVLG